MFGKEDVLKALRGHIGRDNGQRADLLVMEITGSTQRDLVGERRLRSLITELRLEGHHVCAHPTTGYFIAASEEELNQTCVFLYERAMASLCQVARMRNVSLPDLAGQLRIDL
jgi:hypothetical protein